MKDFIEAVPDGATALTSHDLSHFLPVRTPKTVTKLPGVILAQHVRCGRQNCRCTHGFLHGPYYYRFWREDGRLKKAYLKLEHADAFRACRLAAQARASGRQQAQADRQTWRAMTNRVRTAERAHAGETQ